MAATRVSFLASVVDELRALSHAARNGRQPAVLAMQIERIANEIEDSNEYEIMEQLDDDGIDDEEIEEEFELLEESDSNERSE